MHPLLLLLGLLAHEIELRALNRVRNELMTLEVAGLNIRIVYFVAFLRPAGLRGKDDDEKDDDEPHTLAVEFPDHKTDHKISTTHFYVGGGWYESPFDWDICVKNCIFPRDPGRGHGSLAAPGGRPHPIDGSGETRPPSWMGEPCSHRR